MNRFLSWICPQGQAPAPVAYLPECNASARRFAVSDLHGCLHTFQHLLERIGFGRHDSIFLLGDLVGKGPDSAALLDFVMRLQARGYRLHALRGNYEQWLLDAPQASGSARGQWAQRQCLSLLQGPRLSDSYQKWLQALPHCFVLPDYYLVHAGLNFNARNPLDDTDSMLHIREMCVNEAWLRQRRLVHGHSASPIGMLQEDIAHRHPVLGIHSGCLHQGQGLGHLACLDLNTLEVVAQPCLEPD
jgi:serine/threonine protein phosphatase 1